VSLAGALAALLGAVVLTAPSKVPSGRSVSQAIALRTARSEASAPGPDRSEPGGRLNRSLERVDFPDWWPRCGWRSIGQREDRIDGRFALTVYYANGLAAYTIVAAPALPVRARRRGVGQQDRVPNTCDQPGWYATIV
jgi:hypothetical protein